MAFHVPEAYRVRTGVFASDERYGNNGAFFVPNAHDRRGPPLKIIASDGEGWEHVSDADCVVQFHPPRSEYVNNHPYCLHLWRPTGHDIPTPPALLVGSKQAGVLA